MCLESCRLHRLLNGANARTEYGFIGDQERLPVEPGVSSFFAEIFDNSASHQCPVITLGGTDNRCEV